MNIIIRLAKKSDLQNYTKLLQKTYEDSYVDETLGLAKDLFSMEIFNSLDTQNYLSSNLVVNKKQKTWLAFVGLDLVGSITIAEKEDECELRGFYVASDFQGQGIGKRLWKLALNFSKNKDIVLDIYAHNTKTIEMYKRWGFKIDTQKGEFYRHWPEWPDGVKAKSIYMRYSIAK